MCGCGEKAAFPQRQKKLLFLSLGTAHHPQAIKYGRMMESNRAFLSHIIYPESFINESRSSAWLVGWNIDEFKCVIACLIEKSQAALQDLEQALLSIQTDSRYGMYQYSHLSTCPIVLGEWIVERSEDYFPDPVCQAKGIWLVMSPSQTQHASDPLQCQTFFQQSSLGGKTILPKLHSLYSLGNKYVTSTYLVSYPPTYTHHLHSITINDPTTIRLETSSSFFLNSNNVSTNGSAERMSFGVAAGDRSALDRLVSNKGRQLGQKINIDRCSELELIVGLINFADDLHALVHDYIHQTPPLAAVTNRFAKLCSTVIRHTFVALAWMIAYISNIWYGFLYTIHRIYSKTRPLLSCVNDQLVWRELKLSYDVSTSSHNASPATPPSSSLTNTSVSLDTLSLCCVCMVEKFYMLTTLYKECILFLVAYNLHPAIRSKLYTSMCYKLLHMFGDVLLGIGLGYVVLHGGYAAIHRGMCTLPSFFTRLIMETLVWFTQSPGGIKLNPYITTAFSSLFVHALQTYFTFISPWLETHTPLLIHTFAYLGGFGLSIQLSLFIDLWYLCTLPYNFMYTFFTHYIHIHASILKSMYLMFTGSKINILRNFRIDSNVYDNTQLWFGMWFFSILFFLFPSFYVYYIYFAVLQFASIATQYMVYMVFCIPVHVIPLYIPILYTCMYPLLYMGSTVGVTCGIAQGGGAIFAKVDKVEVMYDRSIGKAAGGTSPLSSLSPNYTSTNYRKPVSLVTNSNLPLASSSYYPAVVAFKKLSPQSQASSDISPRMGRGKGDGSKVGNHTMAQRAFTFADEDIQLVQSRDREGEGDGVDGADFVGQGDDDDGMMPEPGEAEGEEDRDHSLSPFSKPSSVDTLLDNLQRSDVGSKQSSNMNTPISHMNVADAITSIYLRFYRHSTHSYYATMKYYVQTTMPQTVYMFTQMFVAIYNLNVMQNQLIHIATTKHEQAGRNFEDLLQSVSSHIQAKNIEGRYDKEVDVLGILCRTEQLTLIQYVTVIQRCLQQDEVAQSGRNRLNHTASMKRSYVMLVYGLVLCVMLIHLVSAVSSVGVHGVYVWNYTYSTHSNSTSAAVQALYNISAHSVDLEGVKVVNGTAVSRLLTMATEEGGWRQFFVSLFDLLNTAS